MKPLSQNSLEQAIVFATMAHVNQKDKLGLPYILHPITVMLKMSDLKSQIVAVLHDTVEDTEITVKEIHKYFGAEIADAIDAISKRKNEPLEQYWIRIKQNKTALQVKLEDIAHNLSPERQEKLPQKTQDYLKSKYQRALNYLNT